MRKLVLAPFLLLPLVASAQPRPVNPDFSLSGTLSAGLCLTVKDASGNVAGKFCGLTGRAESVTSYVTDGVGVLAHTLDTSTALTDNLTSRLLSIQNHGTEKFGVDVSGRFRASTGILDSGAGELDFRDWQGGGGAQTLTVHDASTAASDGFKVTSSTTKTTGRNIVIDNNGTEIMAAGAAGVTIGSGGTAISKSLRVSGAIDIANITTHTCLDTTITVTGAATGAECAVGLPTAPTANLLFNCFVSAADTVKLRACNDTGSDIDPASATYAVRVLNP